MAPGGGSSETIGVLWKVVGGQKTGGILVRSGLSLTSTLEDSRLSVGSIVKELAMENNRLRYELLRGEGPKSGCVSLRLRGIELLIRTKGEDGQTEKLGAFRDVSNGLYDVNLPEQNSDVTFLYIFVELFFIDLSPSFRVSVFRNKDPRTLICNGRT